jgi:hypothetical protein
MMRRAFLLLAMLTTLPLLGGCARSVNFGSDPSGMPQCTAGPRNLNAATVLMAQSVPTAKLLPCVRTLPVGWSYTILDARSGSATFWLDSDRDGTRAAAVSLRPRCAVGGATEVPSEQAGTRRFEKVTRVTPGYAGDRYYTFAGGCITYRFNLRGTTRGQPLAGIAAGVGFVTRSAVAREVANATDHRLTLDPAEPKSRS